MSQIAPRMSRTLWPVWCRRAWWGSTESGQNLFTPGVGRRGCVGLGRRGFDDVDGAVGWGRGWGACRRDLGPDACRRSGFPGQGRSGFPGQGARRQGRRWLDDMDTPMEYGLGQRWMAPSRGGMGLGGLGPWCGRQRLWRNNGSVAAGNKSVEVKCDADSYEVKLNVSDFAPDDLSVKVSEGELVIEAVQSELPDQHGTTARQFTRRLAIPEVKCDADAYEVKLNVSDFAPDDLSVKVSEGELVIEAVQSELPDQHGTTARQFTRRFVIPEGVEEETLESELTEDGFLVVTGRMKTSAGDRFIDIKGKQA